MNEDRYSKLEKIAHLRDIGALSEEEFEREKRKVLEHADQPETSASNEHTSSRSSRRTARETKAGTETDTAKPGKLRDAVALGLALLTALALLGLAFYNEPSWFMSTGTQSNQGTEGDYVTDLSPGAYQAGQPKPPLSNEPEETEAIPPEKPSFEDYAVTLSDETSSLKLTKGSDFWMFRTRIREAFAQEADFDSNAVITDWGCGGSCSDGAIINKIDGKIHPLPMRGADYYNLWFSRQRGSNLLLATWMVMDASPNKICVFEAFVWQGASFRVLEGYPKRREGYCPSEW